MIHHGGYASDNRIFKKKLIAFLFLASFLLVITFVITRNFRETNSVIDKSDELSQRTDCQPISVDELDRWFDRRTDKTQISKIIHQTWKNAQLRERQAQWSRTWCEQYSGWRYHLWTDEENEHFVRTKFPWFYPTYTRLSPAILRADSVRYLYMLHYGGIYSDLDYESIRRVDTLFVNKSLVLSLLNYSFKSLNSVPNSWMASRANHPLWTYVLHRIMLHWSRATEKEQREFWNGKAEFFTGPQALFEGLMFYLQLKKNTDKPLETLLGNVDSQQPHAILQVEDITFLGPKLMNAYDWMSGVGTNVCSAEKQTFNAKKCQEIVQPVYAITYWSHTYGHGHQNDANYLQSASPT